MKSYDKVKKGVPNTMTIPKDLAAFCNWVDENGYPISGDFELMWDDGSMISSWFGFPEVKDRFAVFGGEPDGSIYALWLDDLGQQRVVYLGSDGSGRFLMAKRFSDFLRLLAIGYESIPNSNLNKNLTEWNAEIGEEPYFGKNRFFQQWVFSDLGLDIPEKGSEITNLDDRSFSQWVDDAIAKYSKVS